MEISNFLGHIAIRLRAMGVAAVQITIEDTGTGIFAEISKVIFSRYS